ncbi:MAG: hypothetical protein HRU36_04745 [Rickettsiales bacterium]|nr:hypothetical protein [Rickettsiales bacterium]
MSFIKEVKKGIEKIEKEGSKGLKKIEKEAKKGRDIAVDFVKNIPGGDDGSEYRAKKCFKILDKEHIKVCLHKTGEEIKTAQEFLDKDLYVYQTFLGQYDLKFCLKALSKRGVVKCDEVDDSIEVNMFSSDKCFNIFQQNDITICMRNTNTHIVQKMI